MIVFLDNVFNSLEFCLGLTILFACYISFSSKQKYFRLVEALYITHAHGPYLENILNLIVVYLYDRVP